jgi:hypothetical protein
MDCLDARQVISAALDREKVDPVALHEAKAHCRACADCGAFVRTLAVMQRASGPKPPDDLADRAMRRVHEYIEADRAKQERAAIAAAKVAENPAPAAATPAPVSAEQRLRRRWSDPRGRAQIIAWASAAAVFVVGIGYVAGIGVRQITSPTQSNLALSGAQTDNSLSSGAQAPTAESQPPATAHGSAATPKAQAPATAPVYVVLNGTVYRFSGPTSVDANQLRNIGKAMAATQAEQTFRERDVLVGADTSRIYIADDSGAYNAFDRVVRTYEGRPYELRSAPLTAFGLWPTLPSDMTAPAMPDGSPVFTPLVLNQAGASIYRLAAASAAQGIAVGPGSEPSDPAAGNPNWTWWTPVQ